MTIAPELKSINCTSCGAGLNVLGGGRVMVHVCGYCGAELDAQSNYTILRKFSDLKRPDSPFRIGMTGNLFGVDWTIIGTVGMQESGWKWVEHQLFSPTHGYAWLNVEDGNLTFTRRVRKVSHPAWIDDKRVESAEKPPQVLLNGDRYRYYETSTSKITFLEGEFTWAPKIGDRTKSISMLSENAMLAFSNAGKEREMYRTIWLDPDEVAQAFSLEATPEAKGERHPLQPFKGGKNDAFLWKAAALFAAVSLALSIIIAASTTPRSVLQTTTLSLATLPQTLEFGVTRTDRLVRVDFNANPSNAWLFVGVEVIDPEGETLFESGRSMEFYSGYDSEGSWSEGNRNANLKFRPLSTGTYKLVVSEAESELWASGSEPSQVKVSVAEGVRTAGWLTLLALVFGIVTAVPFLRQFIQRSKRFAGSDWSD